MKRFHLMGRPVPEETPTPEAVVHVSRSWPAWLQILPVFLVRFLVRRGWAGMLNGTYAQPWPDVLVEHKR